MVKQLPMQTSVIGLMFREEPKDDEDEDDEEEDDDDEDDDDDDDEEEDEDEEPPELLGRSSNRPSSFGSRECGLACMKSK